MTVASNKEIKVVVTGATGFIGKRVVKRLIKHYSPNEILCLVLDDNSSDEMKSREYLSGLNVKIKKINLINANATKLLPAKFETLIHLAANTHTHTSDFRVNDQGTKNLFKALNVNLKFLNIVFTSTTAIWSGRTNCSEPITEETLPQPTSEYSRSKLRAQQWLQREARKHKFNLTILYLPTVYGSGARQDSMFPVLKRNIESKSLSTRLNWPGLTGLLHVDDAADIICRFAIQKKRKHDIQDYIVQAEAITLKTISQIIYKKLNKEYEAVNLPKIIWFVLKKLRLYHKLLEYVLPSSLYNIIWRVSLIVDDVICCDSRKLREAFPHLRYKKFKENALDSLS